ncbi:hypothetical protein DFR47_11150 [Pseudochrobactrum asaccharolyticum]|uniref:Uncharacterized protein n=1 Tax=Pseudochrobactrum asaccharolyticum TaxID=354351 RepID=A0A366DLZ3_9HYPH|nr:hypothetical protein DFR47_11150 [Pseudochrobactrum asaccharolyticum]
MSELLAVYNDAEFMAIAHFLERTSEVLAEQKRLVSVVTE